NYWALCYTMYRDQGMAFHLQDGVWVERPISGAPSVRIRAAVAEFGSEMLVFGGRAMDNDGVGAGMNAPAAPDKLSPRRYPDYFAKELLADTYLYDGSRWKRILTQNAPPASEDAQLIHDRRRGRAVLIGGRTAASSDDRLAIHEFDGIDWVQRIAPGDPNLPRALRGRRGM